MLLTSLAAAQPSTPAPVAAEAASNLRSSSRSAAYSGHMAHYDALRDELALDDAQQQRVKGLLKAADSDFLAARREMTPTPEVTRRMTETVKEIEAAKAAGDAVRERELVAERAKLTQSFIEKRDKMVEHMSAIDASLKRNIAEALRPDQLEKFDVFWSTRFAGAAHKRPYDGPIRSAAALRAATDRLGDLTPDQQSQIDAAFKTHQEAMRNVSKPAAEEQALRALYLRVFEVFTDGQRGRVEQELNPKDSAKPVPAAEPAKGRPAAVVP